jgi:hypothetical protein
MIPGITDTECRMAEFRYRELQAEVARQRRVDAAIPGPAGQVRVMETIQRDIGTVLAQFSRLLQRVRPYEATDPATATSALAVN